MKTKLLFIALLVSTVSFGQLTNFRTLSASGTAVQVNTGNTQPREINIVNDTATILFVKLYDAASFPAAATAKPVLTIMCPANSSQTINLNQSFYLQKGLWIRAGKGVLDADSTFNKFKNIIPIIEITY